MLLFIYYQIILIYIVINYNIIVEFIGFSVYIYIIFFYYYIILHYITLDLFIKYFVSSVNIMNYILYLLNG